MNTVDQKTFLRNEQTFMNVDFRKTFSIAIQYHDHVVGIRSYLQMQEISLWDQKCFFLPNPFIPQSYFMSTKRRAKEYDISESVKCV